MTSASFLQMIIPLSIRARPGRISYPFHRSQYYISFATSSPYISSSSSSSSIKVDLPPHFPFHCLFSFSVHLFLSHPSSPFFHHQHFFERPDPRPQPRPRPRSPNPNKRKTLRTHPIGEDDERSVFIEFWVRQDWHPFRL